MKQEYFDISKENISEFGKLEDLELYFNEVSLITKGYIAVNSKNNFKVLSWDAFSDRYSK